MTYVDNQAIEWKKIGSIMRNSTNNSEATGWLAIAA
jgi:hypothetical protein